MKEIKTIGILTSGGDAPGMNAAVRAVARTAISKGLKVYGIRRGYTGLISGDMFEMNLRSVSDIINRGGTIIYSARCPEFRTMEGMLKAKKVCEDMGIDSLVVIGGDGSFRGARDMNELGIPCIAIPGTIDNDIGCSDYTVGFDTALNTAMKMVDNIRDTAQSHDRCSIVEVMGRNAGYIALYAGIACGATAIIIPENEFDFEKDIIDRMRFTQKTGKKHFIIVVAEGVGNVEELAKDIEERTGIESRATVLGHVQRGGRPSARDRFVASLMGHKAVELLLEGKSSRVVVMKGEEIVDYDIEEGLKITKVLDNDIYQTALDISI